MDLVPTQEDQSVIPVFIIDDHPMIRLGLSSLINTHSGIRVCGEHDKIGGTIQKIVASEPKVIFIDLNLPDGSGLSLIKDIRSYEIHTPIIVYSINCEEDFAERALNAGANGYLMKQSDPEKVVQAIKAVYNGNAYFSKKFTNRILQRLSNRKTRNDEAGVERLSAREFEIFQLIGRGFPIRTIATELSISPKTVEAHRGNIRSKLEISSSAELSRYAIHWIGQRES